MATIFIDMSLCVRIVSCSSSPFSLLNSFAASPTADLMTPKDLTIPITPAVAIPPIPICLAYSLNISSADICPTVEDIPVFMKSST